VPLKEKPARVDVVAPPGADVTVDGRPAGETPLHAPLDLPAGSHLLAVSKNGHEAFVRDLDLARGEERRLDAPLPATRQRAIAIGVLVTSAVTLVGAGTCAAFAAAFTTQANGIRAKQTMQNISLSDRDTYDDAVQLRGDFLAATGIGFAATAVLAATGVVLYVFDKPQTTSPERKHERAPTQHKPELDIGFAPVVGPTGAGAFAFVRF